MSFEELYERAKAVAQERKLWRHSKVGDVGAAILTKDNHIYVGISLDMKCSVGFCAERAAAAAMLAAGENVVTKVIAVRSQGEIIPPCGVCREFLSLLAPENIDAEVKLSDRVVRLRELLPFEWKST